MLRRKTSQCTLVLETVERLNSHATADEVYEEIKKKHPEIGRATVYRNLNKLCEMNLIRKREIPGDAERFDHICTNHYHAKCIGCGKIFDINLKYIPDIENFIKNQSDFLVLSHDIVFKGYCDKCKTSK